MRTKQALEKNYADQIQSIETEKRKRVKLLAEIRAKKALEISAIEALKQAADQLNATVEALSRDNTAPVSLGHPAGNGFYFKQRLASIAGEG